MKASRPALRITRAMVLAAGLSTRLRPLTNDRPKALVALTGRPLIDRILDRLAVAGIESVVVNLHYKADALRKHLGGRSVPAISFSDETTSLLDTGGGVAQALGHFDDEPFLAVNCDVLWLDGVHETLSCLAAAWDDARSDALLLLQPTVEAIGYHGLGDFFLSAEGGVRRRHEGEVAPFVFTGIQILHPRLFGAGDTGAFSLNRLYDRAEKSGQLRGLRHEGVWLHIGQPDDLRLAETALRDL